MSFQFRSLLAGGIMDGRGVLASIVLGAEGVQMGTAFLTSQDSNASELLRDAIINSKETDTVITKAFSGKLARGINNRFIEEMSQYEGDIPDYPIQNELTSSIRKAASKHRRQRVNTYVEWTKPATSNNASRQHHHVQYNQSN